LNIFQKQIKNFVYFFSAPIQKQLWKAGDSASNFLESIISLGDLKIEAEKLSSENQILLQKIANLNELKKENEDLRQVLSCDLLKEFKLKLAQVIGKDISDDSVLIDKGFLDGISLDMPVVTKEQTLLGKVTEVYEHFSRVTLITNKRISFDVKIQREDKNISGIIKGKGNLNLILDLIEEDIYEEDIVLTSCIGNIFPEALLVGRIKTIKKSELESFRQAEVDPFFDISQLENVFIILEF
jgi:rod shape-determining protein MreC